MPIKNKLKLKHFDKLIVHNKIMHQTPLFDILTVTITPMPCIWKKVIPEPSSVLYGGNPMPNHVASANRVT